MFTIRMRIDQNQEKKYRLETTQPNEQEEQEERSDNNGVNDQNED